MPAGLLSDSHGVSFYYLEAPFRRATGMGIAPMARDPHIPLFLWIATAVLVHLAGGGGADQAAKVIQERMDVRRFAESVLEHVRQTNQTFEVALLNDQQAAQEEPRTAGADQQDSQQAEPNTVPEKDRTPPPTPSDKRPIEKKTPDTAAQPKKEAQKDEPTPPKEEKKPEEKKKAEEEKPKPIVIPDVNLKNRIAVQQHVDDPNQADNPEAEFIGDQANRVKEQTQARITSTDQNDKAPTPGTTYQGGSAEPGNAFENDVAQSEDVPGEIDRAPNEKAGGEKATASSAQVKGGGNPNATEAKLERTDGKPNGAEKGDRNSAAARPAHEAAAASRATEGSPETVNSPGGSYTVPEARQAQAERSAQSGQKRRLPPLRGQQGSMDFLGLGATGTTRGGINLNLSHADAFAAVGRDQLSRERLADGERRRSTHRGSWKTLGIERWRAAIENYNSSVKPGNQTALNTARVPFASYLNQIHNRLHPIFADSFLASLDSLPRDHPMNRPDMKTNLEIVLDQEEGKIVKMGVTLSSGSTVFDIAALEAVQSASPFGKPPKEIVSPDGNVYLHWEFYRNPYYACSTYFAKPFILNVQPKSAPPSISPPTPHPFGPREEGVPRQGRLDVLPADLPLIEAHASR